MDKYLVMIFNGFLDHVKDGPFTIYDFIEYVKNRYPKKTPTTTAAAHICRMSDRCRYDIDNHCYVVVL